MPRTQVPEEQQRVSDLSELKNELAPTEERVVFVETAALSEPNFYWWDSSGDASTADGVKSVASNLSGFQDGEQNEGLWRRFDASFESATTDDLVEGSTNLYFSDERVDDRVSNLLVGGTNVTLSYNDGSNTLTVDSTDTDTQLTNEEVQDAVYNNVLSGIQTLIDVTYDDANNEVDYVVNDDLSLYDNSTSGFTTYDSTNFDSDFSSKSTDDLLEGSTNLYFSGERVDDRVANLIVGGTNITTTYDDVNNTLTIDGSDGTPNLQNISTDTTTSGDRYYSVNSSSSEVTLTLSTPDAKNGKEISVKRRGKKKVFINTEGSQTIDGSNKVRLNQDKNAVKLVFNSSNSEWEIY